MEVMLHPKHILGMKQPRARRKKPRVSVMMGQQRAFQLFVVHHHVPRRCSPCQQPSLRSTFFSIAEVLSSRWVDAN